MRTKTSEWIVIGIAGGQFVFQGFLQCIVIGIMVWQCVFPPLFGPSNQCKEPPKKHVHKSFQRDDWLRDDSTPDWLRDDKPKTESGDDDVIV